MLLFATNDIYVKIDNINNMYLKRLEIQGFKSFAKKTVIDFLPPKDGRFSVTAIVGPNGSGKSNISDAIRWVMGEQSMRAVRGKKGEDVIFNGSESRGRLSMAEVVMVLDNRDGRVLKDYSEISITRRLYRSGESEYLINNNQVRLFDIHLMLAQAQFAASSYSIISQGTIDRMLLLNMNERKDFLDEASGIKEFKIKRRQAELKLARALNNMEQAERLMQEVEPRLKILQRQVKKLEKRQILEVDLKDAQEKYYYTLYTRNKKELDEVSKSLLDIENNYKNNSKELLLVQEELGELARSASRQDVFIDLQKQHEEAVREKNNTERELAILEGQMHTEYGREGKQNITWLEKKSSELKLQLDKVSNEIGNFQSKDGDILDKIVSQNKQIEEYSVSKSEALLRISVLQSEIFDGQSEQSYMQFSGLTTVKAVLEARDTLGKIYGVVAELGEVKDQYRIALDVAAGGSLASIVVKSSDVAKSAIDYLRARQLGVATFLPIDKISKRYEDSSVEAMLEEYGVIGKAIDLIKFDDKFYNIFSYILGNTVIVKDLEAAKIIGIGRARMVTLDGDVVEKRGVMKGGWRHRRHNALGFSTKVSLNSDDRLKECQKNITEENQNLVEIEANIEKLKNELQTLEVEKQSGDARNQILESSQQNLDKELSTIDRELSFFQMSPEELGDKLSELSEEKDRFLNKIKKQSGLVEYLDEQMRQFNENEEQKKQRVFALQDSMQIKQNEINNIASTRNEFRVQLARLETRAESLIEEVQNDMNISLDSIVERYDKNIDADEFDGLAGKIQKLKYQLNLIGGIDDEVVGEHESTKEKFDFLFNQLNDLRLATDDLNKMIVDLDEIMKTKRCTAFKAIRKEFDRFFKILFEGGKADLIEVYKDEADEEEDILSDISDGQISDNEYDNLEKPTNKKKKKILAGIDIIANPPGKKIKNLNSLSGGERTLTSIALICAVLNYNPSPFVVLDEVEAALDEANTIRFTKIISELSKHAQFILITHNRVTMHAVDALYGVAMIADGTSKLLSVDIDKVTVE